MVDAAGATRGLLLGWSAGALRWWRPNGSRASSRRGVVVAILPDGAERYLSEPAWRGRGMSLRLRAIHTERGPRPLVSRLSREGCGVLVGRDEERRIVERVVPLDNRRGRRARHAATSFRRASCSGRAGGPRGEGLDVLGFFHSHPDHPARPSAFDLEHAWPYYSYLIVSVAQGPVAAAASWRLAPTARASIRNARMLMPVATSPSMAAAGMEISR